MDNELEAQERCARRDAGKQGILVAQEAGGASDQTKLTAIAEDRAVGSDGTQVTGAVVRAQSQGAQIGAQPGHAKIVAADASGV